MARVMTTGFEWGNFYAERIINSTVVNAIASTAFARTGTYSLKIQDSTSVARSCNPFSGFVSTNRYFYRFYYLIDATPTAQVVLVNAEGVGAAFSIYVNTDRTIELRNAGGTVLGTSSAITAQTWNRIEFGFERIGANSDYLEFRVKDRKSVVRERV